MIRKLLAFVLAMSASGGTAQAPAVLPDDQAAMKAHVLFLASDAMRGREAGSPEYDIAAQYVAAQFFAAGLRPAGDAGGYLQAVPLVRYAAASEGAFVWTPRRRGAARRLVFGTDYIPAANPVTAAAAVTAPVIFVGYGIRAPQYGHDDYRSVDVRGKIVAYVGGAPATFGGEERAFFGSPRIKAQGAAALGAVAVIQIAGPGATAAESARSASGYRTPRMTWARADGTGQADAPIPLLGTLTPAGAAKLFADAPVSWAAIVAQAGRVAPRYRTTVLAGILSARTTSVLTAARSSNVVGMIPGSDPDIGGEVVVLSAHLDHIGVTPDGAGDRINNGALDNAIGIASLIEEAKRFKASGVAPKRTILFLAVTAEEKGLIGSDYFAQHPTVPRETIVADVNLDMPILTYRFEDMIVFGAERSTLGPIVRDAVEAVGVALSPDPSPELGIFVRSDHFRFVQQGIPSVFLWPGAKGAGKAATGAFMANCYHKPCDDLTQPILWDQGVRFVDVNYRIARAIADGPARPVWNRGDYFGTLYKGPMAK
jgi:hypothetical protein